MELTNKKLNEIALFFEDGNWIESKDQSSKGFWLVQTGNVGVVSFKDKEIKRFVSEDTFNRLKCTEIFAGDILISRLPEPVGRSCIVPQSEYRMLTAVDCTILRLQPEYDVRYVNYAINSNLTKTQVYKLVTGSSRKRISRRNLGTVEIPIPFKNGIPDLIEQQRIADILDIVFGEIGNGEGLLSKQKDLSNALYQSFLRETFSDESFNSVNFSEDYFRINTRTSNEENLPENFNYIDIEAVKIGRITNPKTLTKKQAPSRARRLVKEGDVLIASVRPYLRSFAVIPKEYSGSIASTGFFVIEKSEDFDSRYILHYILSELFIEQTNKLMKGAQYPALNKELLSQTSIPFPFKNGKPDIIRQRHIADRLDEVFKISESLNLLISKQNLSFTNLRAAALDSLLYPVATSVSKSNLVISPIQLVSISQLSNLQQAIGLTLKRFPRGEMVVAKVLYLAQSIFKVPLGVSFTQQAFGPYSFDIKTAIDDGLSSQKGIFVKKGTKGMEVLSLSAVGTNALNQLSGGVKKPMEDYLNVMMPLYFSSKSNSIELLATICKIIEDEKTFDDQVIYKKLQKWKPNKFGDSEIYRTISLIKKQKWDQKILQV